MRQMFFGEVHLRKRFNSFSHCSSHAKLFGKILQHLGLWEESQPLLKASLPGKEIKALPLSRPAAT
jgi:hypothetical protein